VNHVKTITERNKKLINERDPEIRRRNHEMLHRSATDPKLAREYILRTSLMKSLDEAAAIQ
jgi:3-(3-hydroxy-phenyl)propionate hydroxylase